MPLHNLLDIEGPSAPLLAPPCEATQGGDCFPRKDPIVFNHLVDYKGSGNSLKRIKEDHNQFLRGKFPFPDSRRRARLSSIHQNIPEAPLPLKLFSLKLLPHAVMTPRFSKGNELTDRLQWWVIRLGSNPAFTTTLLKRLVKSLSGLLF